MHPSCSNFALATFKEKNFAGSMALSADRLMRCAHDHKNYSLVVVEKGIKMADLPNGQRISEDFLLASNNTVMPFGDRLRDDDDLSFIKWLISNGYYSEAILEINRQFYIERKISPELLNNLLIALSALGRYEDALFEYNKRVGEKSVISNHELEFRVALIHSNLENRDLSDSYLDLIIADKTSSENTLIRSLSLKSVNRAMVYEWDKVIAINEDLLTYELFQKQAAINLSLALDAKEIKEKKPFTAGALSALIPGLGYAYSGHFQTGISALVVNGLLAFATYSSLRTENYGLAALTGIFNLTFYLGNVSGSAKSAKRYNESRKKTIGQSIKNHSFIY